ncbi:MAG TPA: hypothetical protein PK198_21815, partial [Saprospiraceae bacterium]|nr:hypothetical protein [Saprospiraceae bacterium]
EKLVDYYVFGKAKGLQVHHLFLIRPKSTSFIATLLPVFQNIYFNNLRPLSVRHIFNFGLYLAPQNVYS